MGDFFTMVVIPPNLCMQMRRMRNHMKKVMEEEGERGDQTAASATHCTHIYLFLKGRRLL